MLSMDNYPERWTALAEPRGWDRDAHAAALASGDIDAIALTHPVNWLTEDEMENAAA